ncbi:MAG: U32 family peptidase [Planctomycetes bacterium]|nr:U32 family peptidase [Planctomycetota bacterium]
MDPAHNPPSVPELLAPAGDDEALRAAVANGANAVYFGLSDFNARHRATNFTLEQLPTTMQYLHDHRVRGYVTFNTLVFSDELPRAVEFLTAIIRAGADAVIVQDLGIVRLIKRLCPEFPVHGSTQMTLTEPRGVEFVRHLGVERVILARELSTHEIGKIAAATTMPLEVFVHGALCVAYSGQCLTSEALGGRSANRGQCAQACRQPYEMFVDGKPFDLGDKAYLLSPQDLAAYDLVDDLADLGVVSLKIEGRLKSAHYVAATTQTYRAAIDAYREQRPFQITQQQEIDLAQSFSRGFTHGFLDGVNHQVLVEGRFPKNRGVRIGTVVSVSHQAVTIEVDQKLLPRVAELDTTAPVPLKPGDGVVFDEGHPEQDEQGGRVFAVEVLRKTARFGMPSKPELAGTGNVSAAEPLQLRVTFGRGDVNLSAVAVGATMWRTDDPALRRRLERSFTGTEVPQHIALSLEVRGKLGDRLRVVGHDDRGRSAEVDWEQPLEAARKHPLSLDLVREQFGRLGGTPFHLASVRLIGESGSLDSLPVMVPKSVLNDLRRRLLAQIEECPALPTLVPQANLQALAELRDESRIRRADSGLSIQPQLTTLVRTWDQLAAVLAWKSPETQQRPDIVYCDFEDVRLSKKGVEQGRADGLRVAVATPRVVKPGEDGLLLQVANCQPDAVLIRNLAALSFFQERFPQLPLIGDYSLNVANELTAALFAEVGLKSLVPSYDLNLDQLQSLLQHCDPALFEVVIHQHMPMFHMEHCVFSHALSNGKDYRDCGRPCESHLVELRDHVGESHPLVADVGCRNTLFRARAQSAAPYVPRLLARGVRRFRVELLRESAVEAKSLLDSYARVLAGKEQGPRVWHELRVLNQVGITRGTLEFE